VREKVGGDIYAMKVLRKDNIIKRNQVSHHSAYTFYPFIHIYIYIYIHITHCNILLLRGRNVQKGCRCMFVNVLPIVVLTCSLSVFMSIIHLQQVEHTKTERNVLGYVRHPFIVGLNMAFQTREKVTAKPLLSCVTVI
jgi:hypothetical protein